MFKYATLLIVTHKNNNALKLTSGLASELLVCLGNQIRFPREASLRTEIVSQVQEICKHLNKDQQTPGQTQCHQQAPSRLATESPRISKSILMPAR